MDLRGGRGGGGRMSPREEGLQGALVAPCTGVRGDACPPPT